MKTADEAFATALSSLPLSFSDTRQQDYHHFDMFRRGIKRWNIFIFFPPAPRKTSRFCSAISSSVSRNPQQSPGTSPVYDLRLFLRAFQRFVGIRHQPGFPAKARLKVIITFSGAIPSAEASSRVVCGNVAGNHRLHLHNAGECHEREQQQIRFAMFGKRSAYAVPSALM